MAKKRKLSLISKCYEITQTLKNNIFTSVGQPFHLLIGFMDGRKTTYGGSPFDQ